MLQQNSSRPRHAAPTAHRRIGHRPAVVLAAAILCAAAAPAAASAAPTHSALNVTAATSSASSWTPAGFIEPDILAGVQRSIVGLVTVWEEPVDPMAMWSSPASSGPTPVSQPAISICTGWFDSPTTIATAGHCVDPKVGRTELDWQNAPVDPQSGMPTTPPAGLPDPTRTVYAFQPRELPGAVLQAPVVVHVDSYRSADDGDTAQLDIVGIPAATPLRIAAQEPRIGEPVTSIGFAGMNIRDTDGVNLAPSLTSDGQSLARMLQDSRLQPVSTSGTVTSRQYRGGMPVSQVSADFDQGMSGGPTINAAGEVYGINSKMTIPFFGQNFNVVTDTTMLRHFLHPNDVTTSPAGTAPSQSGNTVIPENHPPANDTDEPVLGMLTGLIAATLAGIGLGWLVARRHRRAGAAVDGAGTAGTTRSEFQNGPVVNPTSSTSTTPDSGDVAPPAGSARR